jgi:hypothetical protein
MSWSLFSSPVLSCCSPSRSVIITGTHNHANGRYDLEQDSGKTRTLATNPEHRLVLAGLLGKRKKFQQETNDPWVHKWVDEGEKKLPVLFLFIP